MPAALRAAFPDMAPTAPADVTVDRLRDMLVLREALVDRRAELKAVPGEVGEPDADGPVRRVLEEPDGAVAASGRRIEELVKGSEGLAESCGIRPRCRASARSRPRPRSPGRAGRARSATAGPPPWPASPPSPATAAPSGAGAT